MSMFTIHCTPRARLVISQPFNRYWTIWSPHTAGPLKRWMQLMLGKPRLIVIVWKSRLQCRGYCVTTSRRHCFTRHPSVVMWQLFVCCCIMELTLLSSTVCWASICTITIHRVNTHTHTHPFNGPFSRTTRVNRYQKGKTNLDFTESRDSEWQWRQLGHMQVCILLQTDNHASTPPLKFFLQAGCHSCRPTNSVKALKALQYIA